MLDSADSWNLRTEADLYPLVLYGFLAVAALTFPLLFFISAPYGRHARDGWGPKINATLAWVLMEAPSPIVFGLCWLVGEPTRRWSIAGLAFLVLWETHYLNRTFVFPFRRRGGQKDMPLSIALTALTFNLFNAYVNGRWLFLIGPARGVEWLRDPRFLVGAAMFAFGFFVNQQSDHILFHLRKPGETGYKIPRGGFYRFVSCPNYFGEIVEWTGFAILTWSPGAVAFVLWTIANLMPRARTHHQWYRDKFPDYPPERRAIFPLIY